MCKAITRTWLFVFNSVFFVGGIVLCALGGLTIAFHSNINADKNVYGQEILSIGIVLAVIGAVVMIVTFLGCFGALSLNKCCLLTFAVFLTLIVAAQVSLTIYGAVQKDLPERITSALVGSNWNYKTHQNYVDWFQNEFECCGYNDYNDYKNNTILILPSSCCKNFQHNDVDHICPVENCHKIGCREAFLSILKRNRSIIIGFIIVFALVELVGIVFSCVLLTRKNRAAYY